MRKFGPWVAVFVAVWVCLLWHAPDATYFLTNADHGSQVSQGSQILLGRTPGYDLWIFYGPMVMYSCALARALSGSLVGEVVLCATCYALAITLVGFLVRQYASRLAAVLAIIAAYLLQARFYKWYFWLFPLLNLWLLHGYLQAAPARRSRWACALGFVLGVEWLYRFDMGTSGLLFSTALMVALEWQTPRAERQLLRRIGGLLVTFALPLAVWFGYLTVLGGPAAIVAYFRMTFGGASGAVLGMQMGLPLFLRQAPLSSQSLLNIVYVVVPLTYLLGLIVGLVAEFRRTPTPASRFLLVSTAVGLSILHQALHRRGPYHLLQVLPPAIITAVLLNCRFLESRFFTAHSRGERAVRCAGLTYFALCIISVLGLVSWGVCSDLSAPTCWPGPRYALLADPLVVENQHPVAELLRKVLALTDARQSLLVFPRDPQYYALTGRRISGKVDVFQPSLYDSPDWQQQDLAAIEADRPALVVVRADFLTPDNQTADLITACRNAHPLLGDWIRKHYPQVVYQHGDLLLLAPREFQPAAAAASPKAEDPPSQGALIRRFDAADKFAGIEFSGDLQIQHTPEGVKLTTAGKDPHFFLPAFDLSRETEVWLTLDVAVPTRTRLQVFFVSAADGSYREEDSQWVEMSPGPNHKTLRLPPGSGKGRIRLDPGEASGEYFVGKLEFRSKAPGKR